MPPMPENTVVPNPTKEEVRPEKNPEAPTVRVKFTKSWNYAYGGIDVVRFNAGQVSDVGERCAEQAISDGVAEMTDDEIYDPKNSGIARKMMKVVPENKAKK